jgi:hypothetical protein
MSKFYSKSHNFLYLVGWLSIKSRGQLMVVVVVVVVGYVLKESVSGN